MKKNIESSYMSGNRLDNRFELNIEGNIAIENFTKNTSNVYKAKILNLSLKGFQIQFQSAELVYTIEESMLNRDDIIVNISFEYLNKSYKFTRKLSWYKISFSTSDGYSMTIGAFSPENPVAETNAILEILVSIIMKSVFIGYIPNEIEAGVFESEILDKLQSDEDKLAILSKYKKNYAKNAYFLVPNTVYEGREKIREIVEKIGY
ncbi:MAG TPA: hypothetical protein PLG34_08130 [Spirochaetota bacterium]|jgi:hypothetical protein|nr:MAG: hypothetical protein BWX91_01720 [Spirochaetes bacterium ADurb.Bin133]HNZ28340.1 hypothetical protein [Spirochaetota bacterium]HPY87935.1 hypothetical protein [Spirochaetota bacterium]HQB62596.1 hypothetical protein [Spirochaetota bacterium]